MARVRPSILLGTLALTFISGGSPAGAEPIPARPALVRGNVWHVRNTLTAGFADIVFSYGRVGDHFLMGDWDGDGTKTPGVVRGNTWYLRNSNTSGFADVAFKYGSASDTPVAGDWDGDGADTPGAVREHVTISPGQILVGRNTWHLRNSNSAGFADITVAFSCCGTPIVGDWDGDGDDGLGMRHDGGPQQVTDPSNRWQLDEDLDGQKDAEFL